MKDTLLEKMTAEEVMDLEITDCGEKALATHVPPQSAINMID